MVEAYWELSNTLLMWKTYKISHSEATVFWYKPLGISSCVCKASLGDEAVAWVDKIYYQRACVQIHRTKNMPGWNSQRISLLI